MKDIVKKVFEMFCRIASVTFIFTCTYICFLWGPNSPILVSYVWGILVVSLILSIAWIPFMGDRELSKVQMFFARLAYYIFVNVLAFVVGYFLEWFCFDKMITVVCLEGSIVFVCGFMDVITYWSDKREAKKMLEKLKDRNCEGQDN